MPFNGSGVYQRVRNWVADATAGIKIRADYHDAEDDGFAAGLSNCITRDGQSTITQNIPFNSKRATGLADPINPQDAATKAYADTKASSTGSTFTGDLIIEKDDPALKLDANAGTSAMVIGQKDGETRWVIVLGDETAEAGDNVGSNFLIENYDDAGVIIGSVLNIDRKTGLITIKADPTAALGIATKQMVDVAAADKVLRAGDTMTGKLTTKVSDAIAAAGSAGALEVMGGAANSAMSFHIPSVFGANFGLANDGNFYMGGWSHGAATAYKFWTTRDFASVPGTGTLKSVRLALAGTASWVSPQTVSEPFFGSVCTGLSSAAGGGMSGRFRYLQITSDNTNWFTVAYT